MGGSESSRQRPSFFSGPTARDESSSAFRGRIGIARSDITPPVGIYARNWGAATQDVAASIHRPLTLTAFTLSNDSADDPLILIDADLGWWRPLERFIEFQRRLLEELSIESSRLIFALTHTHAAAPLMNADPSLPGSDLLQPWRESILQAAIDTTRRALNESFDARLEWHAGHCNLAAVRDFPDPDPTATRRLCGYHPGEPADDTLWLARVTDISGNLRATLVNYACHPTTLAWQNTSISPDYVGAMRETIERDTGATSLFMLGACGDLAPRHQYVGDVEVADRHGRNLAHAALSTLYDMEPPGTILRYEGTVESGAPLAVWRPTERRGSSELLAMESTVELELKDWPSADELERQRSECNDRALEERLRRRRDIRRSLGDGATFAVPINLWKIGDAIVVGCCCEPYSILQQELRRRFSAHPIICMNLINGTIGYLPPAELYDIDVYPVWQTPFARGGLERMIEAMSSLIDAAFEQTRGKA